MPRMVGNASTDIAAPRAAIASLRSLAIGMSLLTKSASDDLAAQPFMANAPRLLKCIRPLHHPARIFTEVVPRGLLNQTHRSIAAGASKSIARDIDAMVTLAAALPRDHGGGSRSADARLRRRRA